MKDGTSSATTRAVPLTLGTGTEWVVDAYGCDAGLLRGIRVPRRVCEQVVDDLKLRVVGEPHWHRFPEPGGVTGLYLLSESHLACHTYPEFGFATFNLYCCRRRAPWPWQQNLMEQLEATRVVVRQLDRGSELGANDVASPPREGRP